jgi:ABC-type lipoprotein release transport system permease subunit
MPGQGRGKEALIGVKMQKTLNVALGDKMVLMAQAADGTLGNELYSVAGVFRTGSDALDRSLVLLHIVNAQELVALSERVTEYTLLLDDFAHVDGTAATLRAAPEFADLEVHTWAQLSPDLVAMLEIDQASILYIMAIVFSIVALGIMNTMLMSIFERTREFGIMMALGTRPLQIVWLVVLEAVLLGVVAVVFGAVVGSGLTWYYSVYGIDLREYMDSMEFAGLAIEPILRTKLTAWIVVKSAIIVFSITVAVSFYPAIKAARLKPVEAIHYV